MGNYEVIASYWDGFVDLLGFLTFALGVGLAAVFIFSIRGLIRESQGSGVRRLRRKLFGSRPQTTRRPARPISDWRIAAERVDAAHHPLDIQMWDVFERGGRPVMAREPLGAEADVQDLEEAA